MRTPSARDTDRCAVRRLPADVYSAAQVRELDRIAIERFEIPGYELMCRAGRAALGALRRRWPRARSLAIYCGAGNNAGDGYVLGRLAASEGMVVRVIAVVEPDRLKGDAARAWQDCRAAGVSIEPFDAQGDAEGDGEGDGDVDDEPQPSSGVFADVIADALLGTGLDRPLQATLAAAVRRINSAGRPVLSLDIPTGLHADTGAVLGCAVNATLTVTFVGLKAGLFLGQAPDHRGELEYADLGIPAAAADFVRPVMRRLDVDLLKAALPPRRRTAHKGDNGRLLLVGGAPGMSGAVRLAAEAALRAGAGLVYVATSAVSVPVVMAGRPEIMCRAVESAEDLDPLIELADAIVVGPGLGRGEWGRELWQRVAQAERPLVVDADGLNLLSEAPTHRRDWILTPHPGEAARLLERSPGEIQAERLAAAADLVRTFGGAIVLKGACTLVAVGAAGERTVGAADERTGRAADEGAAGAAGEGAVRATRAGEAEGPELHVCDRGNPGLGSGGTGDVLAGLIGGLLAQTGDPATAARAGVLVHALAADAAAAAGERGMIASDLMNHLRRWVNPR